MMRVGRLTGAWPPAALCVLLLGGCALTHNARAPRLLGAEVTPDRPGTMTPIADQAGQVNTAVQGVTGLSINQEMSLAVLILLIVVVLQQVVQAFWAYRLQRLRVMGVWHNGNSRDKQRQLPDDADSRASRDRSSPPVSRSR